MSCRQRKVIMNALIKSQFGYCPLLWMCHSRSLHIHIDKIHERALCIIYKDNNSSFQQLLKISGSVTIHHKNLQVLLATEVYKALNKLASPLMSELFKENTLVSKNRLDSVSYLSTSYGCKCHLYQLLINDSVAHCEIHEMNTMGEGVLGKIDWAQCK